jgi:hypothetical protein
MAFITARAISGLGVSLTLFDPRRPCRFSENLAVFLDDDVNILSAYIYSSNNHR